MWYHDLNGNALDFCYNAQGYPYALWYNGAVYYYITNLQGDVVHLVDGSGAVVASYEYDPYGNIVSSSGAMAEINPLRYRGYYYDSDTGFYYLQSRYYDPKICRFINADDVDLLGANRDFASYNLFAYCGNNPVNRADNGGEFWHVIVGAVIGGIIGAISSAVSGGDAIDVLIGAAAGAAGGALAASGAGVVVQAIGSATISMASNAASQVNHIIQDQTGETKFDVSDMLFDGAVGLACGIAGGNGASYGNVKGINAATKQWFKKGFFDSNARKYYVKNACRKGGDHVFDALLSSMDKNVIGATITTGKNLLSNWGIL